MATLPRVRQGLAPLARGRCRNVANSIGKRADTRFAAFYELAEHQQPLLIGKYT
jgi:hypothetical protein